MCLLLGVLVLTIDYKAQSIKWAVCMCCGDELEDRLFQPLELQKIVLFFCVLFTCNIFLFTVVMYLDNYIAICII